MKFWKVVFLAGNGLECQRSFFKANLLIAQSQRGWIPMLLTPVSKIVEFQEVIYKDCFEMNPLTLQNQNFSLQIFKEMYLDTIPLLLAKVISITFISVLVVFFH
jgi:hypothetical protein